MTMNRIVRSTIRVICLWIMGGLASGIFLWGPGLGAMQRSEESIAGVKEILKIVSPSIVKVLSRSQGQSFSIYVTGISIDSHHVISNMEVIRKPYSHIYIQTTDNKYLPATLVGKDSGTSIILLKVEQGGLFPVKMAKKGEVGDWVTVVGVMYNKFPSVFQGLVSQLTDEKMILNTPVFPGVSGSAVVNQRGELVGMVRGRMGFAFNPDYTYKDHSAEVVIKSPRNIDEGLCLAVPVGRVVDIANDLKRYGKVRRAWLGFSLGYDNDQISIIKVADNSPAARAGFRQGDILVNISEQDVFTPEDVLRVIRKFKPGQRVRFKLNREGKLVNALAIVGEQDPGFEPGMATYQWRFKFGPETDFQLIEFPENNDSFPRVNQYVLEVKGTRSMGVDLMTLTPELAQALQVEEGYGLLIARVNPGSSGARAGFQPSDVIIKAAGKPVRRNEDLRDILNNLKDNESISLELSRKGSLVRVEMVPDKGGVDNLFKRIRKKLGEVDVSMDEEEGMKREREILIYREELEKMRKRQNQMMEEMKEMKKKLEEKEKKKNNAGKIDRH